MLYVCIHANSIIEYHLIQVMGRSDLSLKISVIGKVLSVLVLVGSLPLGIIPMCWFSVLSSVVILLIDFYYVGKLLHISVFKQIKDLCPSLCLSILMYIAVLLAMNIFEQNWLQLVAGVAVGMLLYIGVAYLLKLKSLYDAIGIIRNMIHK